MAWRLDLGHPLTVRTPGCAALVTAPFAHPPVEGSVHSAAGACAGWIPPLTEPAGYVGAPVGASPLGSPKRAVAKSGQVPLDRHVYDLRVSEVAGVAASLDHDQ